MTHDTHELPKRFKKLVWYKEGEPIPDEARYTGTHRDQLNDYGKFLKRQEYLYEVPVSEVG